MKSTRIFQWQMHETGKEFMLAEKPLPEPGENEVLVKVAGCGVCHTDLSFWHDGVKTKHPLPLTLGHEISGTVIAGPPDWMDRKVIVPAVLPCGKCSLCRKGRSNICRSQLMPGNDFDGGFSSHIVVPYEFLCPVPDRILEKYSLAHLAVIADAVSTPYQVIKKSELEPGDLAVVIGLGGIGIYAGLLAKIFGAKVLALDVNPGKLAIAAENGLESTLDTHGLDHKTIREKVKFFARESGAADTGWKIFEMSGTKAGQELAFSLMTYASTLSVVGFTMDKVEVRLSNLMAYDAKLIGTWGCKPELYPEVLELVADGRLMIKPFVQTFPLSAINEVFRNNMQHKYTRRSVLVPDYN